MKHVIRLQIENFQSHVSTDLEFGPGLNVMIGASDSGKSAILRALRWVFYNEPRGAEFVRFGTRECRVTVTMSDGVTILRELLLSKSGTPARNRYSVMSPGADPQVFEGFGSEVPAEVIRAHGMPQVLLDTDRRVMLSFGNQLEGPFLMTETGSTRARAIGRLLGVHVVDAAMRNTQRDLRTVRGEVGRLERERERYEGELQAYADIPEQEARLERAEELLAEAESGQKRLRELERIRSEIDRVEQECRNSRTRVDSLTAVRLAEERTHEAIRGQERLLALDRIERELRSREAESAANVRASNRLASLPRASDVVRTANEAAQRLDHLQALLVQGEEIDRQVGKVSELLVQTKTDLQCRLSGYEEQLLSLGKCPTCLAPVDPQTVQRLISEVSGDVGV